MLVHRIETLWGEGPYTSSNATWLGLLRESPSWVDQDDDLHPSPHEDNIQELAWRIPENMHFGFGDLRTIERWFFFDPKDAIKLERCYFNVVTYEVDERYIWSGDRQVMFDITQATKVCSNTPTKFIQTMKQGEN